MKITRRGAALGLAAMPAVPILSARAQSAFPSRALTLIIPFPAGGPADTFAPQMAS